MNKDLKPEDFWSGAEKLLDNHYKAKRRRKFALWFLTALTITGVAIYLIGDRNESALVSNNKQEQITPTAETTAPNNAPSSSIPISENNSQNNSDKIPANPKTNSGSINSIHESQAIDKLTASNSSQNKSSQISVKNNPINSNLPNSSQKENSISVSTPTISKNETKEGASNSLNTEISRSTKESKSEIIGSQNSNAENENHSSVLNENSDSKITLPELHALYNRSFKRFENSQTPRELIAARGSETEEPKTKNIPEYRLEIAGGMNQISKSISGFENAYVEHSRNSWENEILTPQLNVALSKSTDHYSFALGLNYIQYGEKVNYDPAVKSKFLVDNSYWNTFPTTYTVTDTNYILGFVYYSQQTLNGVDSNFIYQTDSVEQIVINNNIVKSTGTNVVSYIEMPLTASYYFGKKKFKYGVSAGVAVGMLVYSNGYYLNNQGTDVIKINDPEIFKKVIVNGQVGVELKYCMSANLHFLLRPKYQMNLNSIVNDEAGFKQRYSAIGVTAGVSVLLK